MRTFFYLFRALSPHDHPGMLVTSKILMGSVKRRAWDLVNREKQFELPANPVFDIEDNPYMGIRYVLFLFLVLKLKISFFFFYLERNGKFMILSELLEGL